jgi:PHD/YefM family antitoxin component YafN of YafNO toxin-antitoxin module
MGVWQASVARGRLPEIIDQAVTGTPQFIQRRDGKEVVVVSRDYFERTKPNLKTFLMTTSVSGPGEEDFHESMRTIRSEVGGAFAWCRPPTED